LLTGLLWLYLRLTLWLLRLYHPARIIPFATSRPVLPLAVIIIATGLYYPWLTGCGRRIIIPVIPSAVIT
jgi:hypothetical protein